MSQEGSGAGARITARIEVASPSGRSPPMPPLRNPVTVTRDGAVDNPSLVRVVNLARFHAASPLQ
jgi:hypothetical protein